MTGFIFRMMLPAVVMLCASCSGGHLIENASFRKEVAVDYSARAERYSKTVPGLFAATDTISDVQLREAVQFLLAYMPLSDLATSDPAFVIEDASYALKTRKEMKWGNDIPYEIFLHFVLPPRVNNENTDRFRPVMSGEIRKRVDGLDAMKAALEINHWCHEKVAYQPSDIRTSSPLATILSARGRCGEESTFTVAALRAAGIPARQVYTPRWAHSDDNHAWVEFWVDGIWHYMGACEPEPVPDRGWFTEPARRAMLVHTRAFGKYAGNEPLIRKEHYFSEINTLATYAETKDLVAKVCDSEGKPIPGATVTYFIYNYAEFYPLASFITADNASSVFTTGKGTLLVWADDGKRYGFAFASPADTSVTVTISDEDPEGRIDADIFAPVAPVPYAGISVELTGENNRRLKYEDSIRLAYTAGWMSGLNPGDLARSSGTDEERILRILSTSMGNSREIASFITSSGGNSDLAVRLLENISEKDLRDTPVSVLTDHLVNAPRENNVKDIAFYDSWVLSPRIDNEILSPFRSSLRRMLPQLIESADPEKIRQWIDDSLVVDAKENYYGTPIIPEGVVKTGITDAHSRDILFVALCRTAGIPSRMAPGTSRPQYHDGMEWHDVWFSDESMPDGEKGYVTFVTGETAPVPEYHIHFSLAALEEGKYVPLDYGYNVRINDMQSDLQVYPGHYMLVTGNRDEKGNVMASLEFFRIETGEKREVMIELRKDRAGSLPDMAIDKNAVLKDFSDNSVSLISSGGKGTVIIWLEPGKEPTRHLLNDLPLQKTALDAWGGQFIFITDPSVSSAGFDPAGIKGLPAGSLFVHDPGLRFMQSALGGPAAGHPLPVVLCCDSEGKVTFMSEGYRIGTGEQILKNVR